MGPKRLAELAYSSVTVMKRSRPCRPTWSTAAESAGDLCDGGAQIGDGPDRGPVHAVNHVAG